MSKTCFFLEEFDPLRQLQLAGGGGSAGKKSGFSVVATDNFNVSSAPQPISIVVSQDTTPPTVELQISSATTVNIGTKVTFLVAVSAKLKLGRETLSVTDLTIPVAGVPLTITRSYDSLEAGHSFDFGYGWRLGFGDAKLAVDLSTTVASGWGAYPAFITGTHLALTKADGTREGFTFSPYQTALDSFNLFLVWHPAFKPDPGINDTLTVPDAILTQDGTNSGYYIITDAGSIDYYNPADPTFGGIYTLTNLSGLASTIDANSGKLLSMKGRNNNTLTFSSSAITSNTGKTIGISRDPQGRITAITDPRNHSVNYGYDVNGNLTSVADRAGHNPTMYGYDTAHAHYLKTITDPLGLPQLTAIFDTAGRMTQVTDAASNSLILHPDPIGLTQTVTDPSLPSGQQTATVRFDSRGNPLNVTDPTGAVTSALFDNSQPADVDLPHTVTQVRRNQGGGTTSFTTTIGYDSLGEPTTVTDPTNAITRTTYGPFGEVVTTSDALGNTVTNGYDTNGNLTSTVSGAGIATYYKYDTNNNLKQVTNSPPQRPFGPPVQGAITLYGYDSFGYMNSSTSPTGVVVTYKPPDPNGNQTGTIENWTDPSNILPPATLTTSTSYDANDRVTSTIDQFGQPSSTLYDAKGRVTSTTDTLNNTTTSLYDARDEVIKTTTPNGYSSPNGPLITDTVYDAEGRAIYTDDPHVSGQQTHGTQTIYDSMGRVTFTKRWDNMVISITTINGVSSSQMVSTGNLLSTTITNYNDLGQVTSSTDAASKTTSYLYDLAGRQISVTDPLMHATQTAYDLAGRMTSSTDANNHTTQYVLDGDGKTLKTIFADGTFSTSAYDNQGRRTSATDQMSLTTQYQYDIYGRLTGVVLPPVADPFNSNTVVNPTTNYSYDIYGNMTQITDAYQHHTNFTFDQFGHQRTHTLPMGQSESSAPPDSFGRITSSLDFQGNKTVYIYDTLGRVQTKTLYPYNNINTAGETIGYQFDPLGRTTQVTDTITGSPARVTSYGFDLDNRVTSVTTPEGTINYLYEQTTGRHTETTTSNSDIKYRYDELGRVQYVDVLKQNGVNTNFTITYVYTWVNNISQILYPNGTETDYLYDTLNRLTSVTNKVTSSGTTLSSYSYTLNADGMRTGVAEQQKESDGSTSTTTKTWSYDNLMRLTSETVTSTISANSYTDTYSYDLVGNRLSKTDVVGTTTTVTSDSFNNNDQLTSETGTVNNVSSWSTSFQYDPNGSLTNVTRTGSGAETDGYVYDLQHRLNYPNINRTEQGQSVAITASYVYDDSGYRAQGTVIINNGTPTVTNYLTDTMNPTGYSQVLEEHIGNSSTPSTSYVIGGAVIAQANSAGAVIYLMPDGLGSTRLVVDSSGNISTRFAYDAFGVVLGTSLGVLNVPVTRILFVGQQFDPALLQYNLRARIYNPSNGRFTTLDPFQGNTFYPITLHRYIYAGADPVDKVDPSGKFIGAVIGLLVGFAVGYKVRTLDAIKNFSTLARILVVIGAIALSAALGHAVEANLTIPQVLIVRNGGAKRKIFRATATDIKAELQAAIDENDLIKGFTIASHENNFGIDIRPSGHALNIGITGRLSLGQRGMEAQPEDVTDLFNRALAPDAEVWLLGCNTADGPGSGAQRLSRVLSGRIIHGNTSLAFYVDFFATIGTIRSYQDGEEL